MKGEKFEEADAPVDLDLCQDASRSIGDLIAEILREHVTGLGPDRAMFPDVECVITPAASSGRGQPGRSECDPRAILDATDGGDAGRAVPCGNFLCPRPHFYAAAWERSAAACAIQSRTFVSVSGQRRRGLFPPSPLSCGTRFLSFNARTPN